MKENKKEEAYVRINRELGISVCYCELCNASLDKIVEKNLEKIALAISSGTTNFFLKLRCPKCKKRLNWSKVVPKIEVEIITSTGEKRWLEVCIL